MCQTIAYWVPWATVVVCYDGAMLRPCIGPVVCVCVGVCQNLESLADVVLDNSYSEVGRPG